MQGSHPNLCTFGSCSERTLLHFQFKPFSSLPQLGMCRGSPGAWLVALILRAESPSLSLLLFHFPFLPLRAWGSGAGQRWLCQPSSSVQPWGLPTQSWPQGITWRRTNSLLGALWAAGGHFKPFHHLKAMLSLQTSQPVGIGLLFIPACPAKLTAAQLWEC